MFMKHSAPSGVPSFDSDNVPVWTSLDLFAPKCKRVRSPAGTGYRMAVVGGKILHPGVVRGVRKKKNIRAPVVLASNCFLFWVMSHVPQSWQNELCFHLS